MSSTIDAAIIKALVEHINYDSDNVVIPATWTKRQEGEDEVLAFSLPLGQDIKLLTKITLKVSGFESYYSWVCIGIEEKVGIKLYAFCRTNKNSKDAIVFKLEDGVYVSDYYIFSDDMIPDNNKSGLFEPNITEAVCAAFQLAASNIE